MSLEELSQVIPEHHAYIAFELTLETRKTQLGQFYELGEIWDRFSDLR